MITYLLESKLKVYNQITTGMWKELLVNYDEDLVKSILAEDVLNILRENNNK